jgi:hypothetical protein
MNFGLVEALEKALAPATRQLHELLEGITAEQRETNQLLRQFLEIEEESVAELKADLKDATITPIKRSPGKKP